MKRRILLFCLAVLLLFNGCGRQQDQAFLFNQTENSDLRQPDAYSAMEPAPIEPGFAKNVVPFDPTGFNQKQMLEDYDFFWSVLEENCPLLPLIGRIPGASMDSEQLKEFGRQKVSALSDGDAEGFFNTMLYVSSQFHQMGHIGVISANAYLERMETHNDEGSSELWKIYTDKQAAAFYAWQIQLPLYRSLLDSRYHQNNAAPFSADRTQAADSPSVSFPQGVPVIKISTFSSSGGQTIDRLKTLCLENIQAADLILDLRGNTGGNTDVWLKGLSPLTQGKDLAQYSVIAYRNAPYNRQIWGEEACQTRLDPASQPIEQLFSSRFIETENLNREDLALCDTFALLPVMTLRAEPGAKPLFRGRLWILTDSNVYSAAESFVQFAQSSGLAVVVGENTKGNGTLAMSPPKIPFLLPNSGIIAQYTPFYPINSDGTCTELAGSAPDIHAGAEDALEICLREIAKEETP